jgi:chitinase
MTALRTAFSQLQSKKGDSDPYQITAAVPAGSTNYQWLKVSQMNAAMNYWNLMVNDFLYPLDRLAC